jgi:hypothetical protein
MKGRKPPGGRGRRASSAELRRLEVRGNAQIRGGRGFHCLPRTIDNDHRAWPPVGTGSSRSDLKPLQAADFPRCYQSAAFMRFQRRRQAASSDSLKPPAKSEWARPNSYGVSQPPVAMATACASLGVLFQVVVPLKTLWDTPFGQGRRSRFTKPSRKMIHSSGCRERRGRVIGIEVISRG